MIRADPSSGVSVKPVAASSLASAAVPSPTIAGGASVAAANADTLASSQVHPPVPPSVTGLRCPAQPTLLPCCLPAAHVGAQADYRWRHVAANADTLASRRVRTPESPRLAGPECPG